MDAAGTMHGLLPRARSATAPTRPKRLLIGSHIDTRHRCRRYDGNLGVVAGILAAEDVARRGAPAVRLEVLAFGDEEGVRFPKTLIGSSAVAGRRRPGGARRRPMPTA